MARCCNCRNRGFEHGEHCFDIFYKCQAGVVDLKEVKDIESFETECDQFKSKYIEYPVTVNKIELDEESAIREGFSAKVGDLVAVRPCDEQYQKKTFLGVYLGDADMGLHASYNTESKILKVLRMHNPAIFVPEIRKIIYGCGSWWQVIKDEDGLKAITDNDINNVWYVKLLKSVTQSEKRGEPDGNKQSC